MAALRIGVMNTGYGVLADGNSAMAQHRIARWTTDVDASVVMQNWAVRTYTESTSEEGGYS